MQFRNSVYIISARPPSQLVDQLDIIIFLLLLLLRKGYKIWNYCKN
jgi:hypothetical protein